MLRRPYRTKLSMALVAFVFLGASARGAAATKTAATKTPAPITKAKAPASAPGPSSPRLWIQHYHGGPIANDVLLRAGVVVLNATDVAQLATIHRVNPKARVLVYKDLSSVRTNAVVSGRDIEHLPTGVGYVGATQHPEWFLADQHGRRLEWAPYPGCFQTDVGDAAYQRSWLSQVQADLTRSRAVDGRGWDGVFLDNALTTAQAYHPGLWPSKYPTDAAMQRATASMLAAVGPALRTKGYDVVANIAGGRVFATLWHAWLPLVSGALEEQFANWNPAPGSDFTWDWGATGWRAQVEEVRLAAASGKEALVETQRADTDVEAERYGWASFLLGAGNGSYFGLVDRTPVLPEMSWDLGAASGAYRAVVAGVYRRDFARGTVVVNANHSGDVTVALGRAYVDPSGRTVSTIVLHGMRGMVVRTPA